MMLSFDVIIENVVISICFSLESSSKFQYYIGIAPSVILLDIVMNNLWKNFISFLLRELTELLFKQVYYSF